MLLAREAGRLVGRAVSVEGIGSPGILAELDAATRSTMTALGQSLDLPDNYQKRERLSPLYPCVTAL